MKKDKLLEEFEHLKIENLKSVVGGDFGGGGFYIGEETETENCETCNEKTQKSSLPGDDDCDDDTDKDDEPICV